MNGDMKKRALGMLKASASSDETLARFVNAAIEFSADIDDDVMSAWVGDDASDTEMTTALYTFLQAYLDGYSSRMTRGIMSHDGDDVMIDVDSAAADFARDYSDDYPSHVISSAQSRAIRVADKVYVDGTEYMTRKSFVYSQCFFFCVGFEDAESDAALSDGEHGQETLYDDLVSGASGDAYGDNEPIGIGDVLDMSVPKSEFVDADVDGTDDIIRQLYGDEQLDMLGYMIPSGMDGTDGMSFIPVPNHGAGIVFVEQGLYEATVAHITAGISGIAAVIEESDVDDLVKLQRKLALESATNAIVSWVMTVAYPTAIEEDIDEQTMPAFLASISYMYGKTYVTALTNGLQGTYNNELSPSDIDTADLQGDIVGAISEYGRNKSADEWIVACALWYVTQQYLYIDENPSNDDFLYVAEGEAVIDGLLESFAYVAGVTNDDETEYLRDDTGAYVLDDDRVREHLEDRADTIENLKRERELWQLYVLGGERGEDIDEYVDVSKGQTIRSLL